MVPESVLAFQEFLSQSWPWWVAGPLIALVMFALIFFGKEFGISGNFRVMCAAEGADEYADFFSFDWPSQGWNLMVALGAMLGGYISAHYLLGASEYAHVSEATVQSLQKLGFDYQYGAVPLIPDFYEWDALWSWTGVIVIIVGGFLVGLGARYAGGCTSGHAISGLSSLQFPSLIAVVGFFLGGLFMTHLLFPLIF